jgi:outer membrane protein assembly factor BamB
MDVLLSCSTPGCIIRYTTDGAVPTSSSGQIYTAPVSIIATTTFKAIAFKDGWIDSPLASATYSRMEPAASPLFDPPDGTSFLNELDVRITCSTPDAAIRYTTDGSDPTPSSGTVYTNPIHLTTTTVLKALAFKAGMTASPIFSALYKKLQHVDTPFFSPASQTSFEESLEVRILCTTSEANIRYTIDGADPTPSYGTPYTGLITLTATTTLKAVAFKEGMAESVIAVGTFTRLNSVAPPEFTPADGAPFEGSTYVTISSPTPWAEIRYTVDGTDPAPGFGGYYLAPIHLTATTTLKAIAFKTGMAKSPITSARLIKTSEGPVGTLKWAFLAGRTIDSSPAVAPDGTIYVGSDDGKLYAVNPDGTKQWDYYIGDIVFSSPAIDQEGTIYIGTGTRKLMAFNPNGSVKWAFPTSSWIVSSPALASDGTIYISCVDTPGRLYAVNPNGTQKWEFASGNFGYSSPVVAPDGTIYIGGIDRNLYALTPAGTIKWTFTLGNYTHSTVAIARDGTLYIGCADGKLYAINPDGSAKWTFATGNYIDSAPALGPDGTIYIGSADRNLYAVNPNGTGKWAYSTTGIIQSSPAVGSDGVIYIPSLDGCVYAVNANGTLKWIYRTQGGIDSCPTLSPTGILYVGSKDYKLHAIFTTGQLADSPWPKFHRDLRQTGRAP